MPKSRGNAQVAAVCFDFGDADSGWPVNPPRVLQADGWQFVRLDAGTSEGRRTLKEKPGMRATQLGAILTLDTTRHGSRQLRLGFLQTYSSRAVARLSCMPPCTCAATDVSAHADTRTSLTAYANVPGGFESPPDRTCKLSLTLVETGGPNSTGFKVSALPCRTCLAAKGKRYESAAAAVLHRGPPRWGRIAGLLIVDDTFYHPCTRTTRHEHAAAIPVTPAARCRSVAARLRCSSAAPTCVAHTRCWA